MTTSLILIFFSENKMVWQLKLERFILNNSHVIIYFYLVKAMLSVLSIVATAGVVSLALTTSSEGFRPSRSRKSSLQKQEFKAI